MVASDNAQFEPVPLVQTFNSLHPYHIPLPTHRSAHGTCQSSGSFWTHAGPTNPSL
ncbi:uncharacterized protein MYCGRDRAFT_82455, partial [Zymoseptoria tritici IPO323]